MLLKKQTVWLLTMLSLVVVLSVYYVTSPENGGENLAFVEEDKETTAEETKTEGETAVEGEGTTEESTEEGADGTVISSIQSDELFTALRLELNEERSKMIEELTAIVTSSDVSAEKKSEAYDKIREVEQASSKEKVIETLILAESPEYKDVLVRADGAEVKITIKSEGKHTAASANKIIQLVKSELGQKQVAVTFSAK
jgi:stage III sporulation protein AH